MNLLVEVLATVRILTDLPAVCSSRRNIGVTAASLCILWSTTVSQGNFQGLGDLPGGEQSSQAHGLSRDGSVVVGRSNSTNGIEGFKWSAATGMLGLGGFTPGSAFLSAAYQASGSGDTVVGFSASGSTAEGFRRTTGGGMVVLTGLPGSSGSAAYGVSADGGVIVGSNSFSSDLMLGGSTFAVRWIGNSAFSLGHPSGVSNNIARGVSADGSVIVGYGFGPTLASEAFRWSNDIMVGLGDLPGGNFESQAFGVSGDGSVVVGYSVSSQGSEAFKWTSGTGMVGLGDLPNGQFNSRGLASSKNGSVIVGSGVSENGGEAFIWTPDSGMRSIKRVLETQYGVDLTGWTLREATGVSADGLIIVGTGTNPSGASEAWWALLRKRAFWRNPSGGTYQDPGNWANGILPNSEYQTVFDPPTAEAYNVNFGGGTSQVDAVDIISGTASFVLGGGEYWILARQGLKVAITVGAAAPGVTAGLEIRNGTMDSYGNVEVGLRDRRGVVRVKNGGHLQMADLLPRGKLVIGADSCGIDCGSLEILEGGRASVRGATIGQSSGASGKVLVSGAGSVLKNGAHFSAVLEDFVVADRGRAKLTVSAGGLMTSTEATTIGRIQGSEGEVLVTDSGSVMETTSRMVIGNHGIGRMTVESGGKVKSLFVRIGDGNTGNGSLQIDGSSSSVTVDLSMSVGEVGTGLVRLRNGALLRVVGGLTVGPGGTMDAFGGIVSLGTFGSSPPGQTPFLGVESGTTGGTVHVDSMFLISGATIMADTVIFGQNWYLGGTGIFNFNVTNNSQINPGDSAGLAGTFTVNANYTQTATGTLSAELGGLAPGSEHDVLSVANAATLGGTLELSLIDGFQPQVGQFFQIVNAGSVSGAFAQVVTDGRFDVNISYGTTSVTATITNVTTVEGPPELMPTRHALQQNYPNPFNPSTTIPFHIAVRGHVDLIVYDALGREVSVLVNEQLDAGSYRTTFEGNNHPSGVYFYRLTAGNFAVVKKLLLLK